LPSPPFWSSSSHVPSFSPSSNPFHGTTVMSLSNLCSPLASSCGYLG
jgi:hypothetical protein